MIEGLTIIILIVFIVVPLLIIGATGAGILVSIFVLAPLAVIVRIFRKDA